MNRTVSENQLIDKLNGLLGLSRRGGRLTMGFDAVIALVGEGKAKLILTAADISPKTAKELAYHTGQRKKPPPAATLPHTKEELAQVIGAGKPVGALAVEYPGLAEAIKQIIDNR